ncbi:MAG: hypothetical protein E7404_07445 [Ruminococcaceae bacterium]|nr:hypothetical protein [Oscillospiraceae bacterium]
MKKTLCFLMSMILLMSSFGTVSAKGDIKYIKATPLAVLEEAESEAVAASYDEVRIIVTFVENGEDSAKKVKTASYYEQLMQNIYLFVFDGTLEALEAYEAFKNDQNVKSVSFDSYVGIDPVEEENIKNLTKSLNVEGASLDGTSKPNDYGVYTSQWYLDDIGVYDAWQAMEENFPDAKENSVIVAVIDSGIDTTSPDLKDAILTDENGNYIGFNTISSSSTSFEDDYSNVYHGTAVSSFIAAKSNNGYGICGVAGDYNVKILPLKALNSKGGGSMASIIKAFDLAVENGADVINMSLTAFAPFYTFSSDGTQITGALHEAINLATENGVTVVASAGNYYSNVPLYPASYDNVLSVSAYTKTREKADFSQYNDYIDIAAPGKSMAHINKTGTDGVKENGSGTSYAAPLVSAAAALLKLAYPEITPREISNFIKNSATDLGKDGYDQIFGHGALDVEKAITDLATGAYRPTISIDYPESISVKVGEHKQIETKVLPAYATNKYVRYESFDTSIATVSNNGVVYGVGPGVADILIIPDDTEESYYTTVFVHPNPTAEPDMEYVRQTGEMISQIDITGDEFLFYAGNYLWHGEKDILDGTAIIKPTMNVSGDYTYCTALPTNKENTYSAMYAYKFLMLLPENLYFLIHHIFLREDYQQQMRIKHLTKHI